MKPWLFDILACPIDKQYPLSLYIFSYETVDEEFEALLKITKNRNLEDMKSEDIVKIYREDGETMIQDNLVLKETELVPYLDLIIKSIDELGNIQDLSASEYSRTLLNHIKTEVFVKITNALEKAPDTNLDEILPELIMLNKYKFEIEIETGILFCQECKRWFPIIETIPQMLPDEYREEKEEIEFLKTNKNLLDEKFFHQELKPFNL